MISTFLNKTYPLINVNFSTYQILRGFTEAEDRSRNLRCRMKLRPVSGVDDNLGVRNVINIFYQMCQEVFYPGTAEWEHAVF